MPFETRRIIFNYTELKEAVISYGKKYNMAFPNGEIGKVTDSNPKDYSFNPLKKFRDTAQNIDSNFIITFILPVTSEHKYINLPNEFMVGALVEYCLDHKIILPRDVLKIVDVIEFGITLEMTNKPHEETEKKLSLSFDE